MSIQKVLNKPSIMLTKNNNPRAYNTNIKMYIEKNLNQSKMNKNEYQHFLINVSFRTEMLKYDFLNPIFDPKLNS